MIMRSSRMAEEVILTEITTIKEEILLIILETTISTTNKIMDASYVDNVDILLEIVIPEVVIIMADSTTLMVEDRI